MQGRVFDSPEIRPPYAGVVALAIATVLATAASAQIIPGIETVKVKTIAIEPATGKPMTSPAPTPTTAAATPPSPVGLPAPVRVRTLRISPKGHVFRDVPGYESLPRK